MPGGIQQFYNFQDSFHTNLTAIKIDSQKQEIVMLEIFPESGDSFVMLSALMPYLAYMEVYCIKPFLNVLGLNGLNMAAISLHTTKQVKVKNKTSWIHIL